MERVVAQMAKVPLKSQDEHTSSTNLSNGGIKKEEKPSVKIMGMETSESCEGGKKWQSANSSVLPTLSTRVNEHVAPPQEIYLDKALPPQSQILVADSATETEKNTGDNPAVVLAGKMTLSVISLENENLEIEECDNADKNERSKRETVESSKPDIKEVINDIIEEAIENLENSEIGEIPIENQEGPNDIPNEIGENELNKDINKNIGTTENIVEVIEDNTILNANVHDEIDFNRQEEKLDDNENANNINSRIDELNQSSLPAGNISKDANIPHLSLNAKSSSEESGSTVLSVSNQGSVINMNTRDVQNEDKKETEEDSTSEKEESEVEYEEESEEEIEISEEEVEEGEIEDEANRETSRLQSQDRLNSNGSAVLINGAIPHNGTPEEEDSGEEELVEEIIEEYSEEEEEQEESEEETNDAIHLSSNGNGED
ncbi:hypothetical protein HHI36_003054 [Cryptolaemus montrouzieri]|uniref:Uncharacterized protein n=1 Tax=Cryptolaemus montrouzieri TaxID=559131 RepID=A0ABD2PCT9_9CUCU